jgi:hypothetical protein
MTKTYTPPRVGDAIEFQVRSSLEDAGPIVSARVVEVGAVLGAPYFMTESGFYMLTDLRRFRIVTKGVA